MTLYADQCVQREAHGDVRFSVETPVQGSSMHCNAARGMAAQCNSKQRGSSIGNSGFSRPLWSDGNAWQGNVMQGTGLQFKATRIVHWQQWIFRAALVQAHRGGPQGNAPQSSAAHGNSKQRGSGLGNRLFSGPLWSERTAMQGSALRGTEWHRISKQRGSPTGNSGFSGPLWSERSAAHITASNSKPMQGNTKQRGSPTGNSGFSGLLWPDSMALHRSAKQCKAWHGNAHQSNADRPLATVDFPGRFGSPGRVSPAALSTD